MLRVSSGEGGSFFNADKRKKQVTLVDPTSGQSSTAEDRRPTVAAPKMFAFDAIFTEEDSQVSRLIIIFGSIFLIFKKIKTKSILSCSLYSTYLFFIHSIVSTFFQNILRLM